MIKNDAWIAKQAQNGMIEPFVPKLAKSIEPIGKTAIGQPGVYAIFNSLTNRCYIGGTRNLNLRRLKHISLLRLGKHYCKDLQLDYLRQGEDTILFFVLEVCKTEDKEVIFDAEQKYINRLGIGNLYNSNPCARNWTGAKHSVDTIKLFKSKLVSEETKRRLSLALKGKRHPEWLKAKISEGSKKPKQQDHAKKLGQICTSRNIESSKHWIVTSPDGSSKLIKNLNAFCKENTLNQAAMHRVATGKNSHHKGWKCSYALSELQGDKQNDNSL